MSDDEIEVRACAEAALSAAQELEQLGLEQDPEHLAVLEVLRDQSRSPRGAGAAAPALSADEDASVRAATAQSSSVKEVYFFTASGEQAREGLASSRSGRPFKRAFSSASRHGPSV